MRLIDVMTSPWAIEPQKLIEIRGIYETHLRGEKIDIAAVEARLGQPLQRQEQGYELRDNVAIVSMDGVMARKANMFTRVSGGASTQLVARDLRAAAEDPAAEAILWLVGSPGGTVDGTQELAQVARTVAGRKPLIAVVEGTMASAAYWASSAADQIFATAETDQVGHIGVVATHIDVSGAEQQAGIKTTEIAAGRYKRIASRYAPLSDEGRAHLQDSVDALYTIFVNDVAMYRGVDAERVLADMADGRVFLGREAVKRGLVDGLASFDSIFADLSAGKFKPKRLVQVPGAGAASAVSSKHEPEVSTMDINTLREKHPEVAAALIKEGRDAGYEEGCKVGAESERKRIQDVEAQALPGHAELIGKLKFDGKTTGAEAAVQVLNAERGIRSSQLSNLQNDAPPAVPSAVVPNDPAAAARAADAPIEERAKAAWEKDAKLRAEFGNFDTYLAYAKAEGDGKIRRLTGKAA